jgi:hypothetical protein
MAPAPQLMTFPNYYNANSAGHRRKVEGVRGLRTTILSACDVWRKVLLMNNATTTRVWAPLPALKVKAKYAEFGIRKLICVTRKVRGKTIPITGDYFCCMLGESDFEILL